MTDRLERPSQLQRLLWGKSLNSLYGPTAPLAMTGLVLVLAMLILLDILPLWVRVALFCLQVLLLVSIPLYGWFWRRYWDKMLND